MGVCVVTSPGFFSSSFKNRIFQPTHLATCHAVMGEDKEAEAQQVALETQREPLMVCVCVCGLGERICAAENIYHLCRVPYKLQMGLAYCLFDKICVSALHDAPIILPSHVCIMVVVITPLLKVA